MSYTRYLAAINQALRDTVLPEVQSARARDTIQNSISTIAAIAANFERADALALSSISADSLPLELRAVLQELTTTSANLGLAVPSNAPFEDVALSQQSFGLADAGARWLASNAWDDSPELHGVASSLLNWEHDLRTLAIARIDVHENGTATAQKSSSQIVADISQSALEAYLRQRLHSTTVKVDAFKFLSGGRSRQTALFSISGTDAIPQHLVIQRDHPGAINQFSVATQFPLLKRLQEAGMKVPHPVLLETSRDALGAPFMIVSEMPGEPPMPSMGYWCLPPKSEKLAIGLAQQMALLHSVPIGDLSAVLPHSVKAGQSWLDDIASVEGTWQSLSQVPSMAVTGSLSWMKQHAGQISNVESLVHCDMLLHNLLAEDNEVTAVLDWEAAHIGHPGEDIGYVKPVIEQMGAWPQFLDAYYEAGGYRLTQEEIDFFTLLAISRVMTMGQQARAAFDSCRTNDPTLAEVGASWIPKMVNRLALQLIAIINR